MALEAFLEECEAMGTLQDILEDAGFVKEKESWILEEPVIKEKIALSC